MNNPTLSRRHRARLRTSLLGLVAPCLLMAPALATPATVYTVASISDLEALGASSSTYSNVIVSGAQGGFFVWNGSGSATTDGCTTFAATGVGTGRWERKNLDQQDTLPLSWCDTLPDADAAAVAQTKTLVIDQAVTLSANTTLSARRVVGNELITTAGYTLNVGGFFDPAPYQTFNAAEATNLSFDRPPVYWTAENFGAIGSAAVDDSPAAQAAVTLVLADHGGQLLFRPKRAYRFDSEVTMDLTYPNCDSAPYYFCKPLITGYGSVLYPNGGFSALRVFAGDGVTSSTISGLSLNLASSGGPTAGLKADGTSHAFWFDNTVLCGNSASAFDLGNRAPHTANYGTFWAKLAFNVVTSIGGSCGADVNSHGNTNATNIVFNNFTHGTNGIAITADTAGGSALMPNGFNIDGNTFEAVPTVVSVIGENGQRAPSGLAVVNNQVDSGATTFFNYAASSGTMLEPIMKPVVLYNRDLSGGSYVTSGMQVSICPVIYTLQACNLYQNLGTNFYDNNGDY